MDPIQIDRILNAYMKSIYDVEVDFSGGDGLFSYRLDIPVIPSKFLKNSENFSQRYYNFISLPPLKREQVLSKAFTILGINRSILLRTHDRLSLSGNMGEYLEGYSDEVLSNLNKFFGGEIKFAFKDVELVFTEDNRTDQEIPKLWLHFRQVSGPKSLNFLNRYKDEWEEYLSTKMKVDPQIQISLSYF